MRYRGVQTLDGSSLEHLENLEPQRSPRLMLTFFSSVGIEEQNEVKTCMLRRLMSQNNTRAFHRTRYPQTPRAVLCKGPTRTVGVAAPLPLVVNLCLASVCVSTGPALGGGPGGCVWGSFVARRSFVV